MGGLFLPQRQQSHRIRCPSVEPDLSRRLLRCLSSVTPRQALVEACDLVVGDLREDPCQPGLGIDVIEFGGFDQGEGDGHGFAAPF